MNALWILINRRGNLVKSTIFMGEKFFAVVNTNTSAGNCRNICTSLCSTEILCLRRNKHMHTEQHFRSWHTFYCRPTSSEIRMKWQNCHKFTVRDGVADNNRHVGVRLRILWRSCSRQRGDFISMLFTVLDRPRCKNNRSKVGPSTLDSPRPPFCNRLFEQF